MGKLEDSLIHRMKEYFGQDQGRIRHALRVTQYAGSILQYEGSADRDVAIAAAILHDIGIPEAERKHGSAAGTYQEIEGPPIAKELMCQEGLSEGMIEEVSQIIAHHHTPGVVHTINFSVLYDADVIVNSEDGEPASGEFLTEGGQKVAAAHRS
jgi:putative nucleotidyltransferase with HDIG domain